MKKSNLKKKKEFYVDNEGKRRLKTALENVKKEIAIMKKLIHNNIIRLFEVIENPDYDKIYLVMEYAEQGQLIDWDEDSNRWVFCNDRSKENSNGSVSQLNT